MQKDSADKDVLVLGSGSGVIVSGRGYIVTNHHVVAKAIEVEVILADGRRANAEIIAEVPFDDLALLKIDLPELPVAVLGDSSVVRVGQMVFPIGNPGGAQFARSMTMGVISGVDREVELSQGKLVNLLQTDAAINPGNSGGPLVDSAGRVIGINSIKIVDPEFESMGFAIPINRVIEVLRPLCPEAFLL
ncbi:MAG: trypsin-like peptidase domain-containing protein [Bacillota bacterium]|nr:trypsin-like peptidase domain-containing protein [Bacillota bacterium]